MQHAENWPRARCTFLGSATSTTNPDALTYWGNLLDAHVQIQPGTQPNYLTPTISILGGIPSSMIDSTTGLTTWNAVFALTNTAADSLGRACPFGGRVSVQGELFVGYKYNFTVQDTGGGSPITLTTPLLLTRWDGTTYTSSPDSSGYFTYMDPTQNIDSLLGESDARGDDLWQITLQIADMSDNPILGSLPDVHLTQLDNTAPQAVVHLDNNLDCSRFTVGTILNGHYVAYDINFGSFSMGSEPYAGAGLSCWRNRADRAAPLCRQRMDSQHIIAATMRLCSPVERLGIAAS